MTNETRTTFLRHLDADDGQGFQDRATLVETLRASAARLRDTSSFGSSRVEDASAIMTSVHHGYAAALLDVAQRLCDHGDVTASRCHYCEAVLPGYRHDGRVIG